MNDYGENWDNFYYERGDNWKASKVPYREAREDKPVNSRAVSQLKRYKFLENKLLNRVR